MKKPLHENFLSHQTICLDVMNALLEDKVKPKKTTIANIMAYSKALSVQNYETIGQQDTILN